MISARIRIIYSYLRIIIGLGLIALLFYKIPFEETFNAIKDVSAGLIILALCLVGLKLITSSVKLYTLVKLKNKTVTLISAIKAYYIGYFFNNFVPTDVGGDIFKINELTENRLGLKDAASAVVIERFTGALALVILAALSVLPPIKMFKRLDLAWAGTVFAVSLLTLTAGSIIAYAGWRHFAKPYLEQRKNQKAWGKIYKIVGAFYVYKDNMRGPFLALMLSFVGHLIGAAVLFILAAALNYPIPFIYLIMIIPVISFVSLLPVSLGALGVREGVLVFCLAKLGMGVPEALSLAVILRLCAYVHSGIGGLVYSFKK